MNTGRQVTLSFNDIREFLWRNGFDIVKRQPDEIGQDPFVDMQRFLKAKHEPLIFDVGANIGQSAVRFTKAFPSSTIHSFEPSPSTFEQMKTNCLGNPKIKTWNYGIGSQNTTLTFQENEHPNMSSFLAPSNFCWGNIVKKTEVQVITLDSFSQEHNIEFIDVLKSDTQGFELEVFKGAQQLMNENKIALIYFEFIFSDMYKELPKFHEVFQYLIENHFSLVTFYDQKYQQELVSWTDVMFINQEFNSKRAEQNTTPVSGGPA